MTAKVVFMVLGSFGLSLELRMRFLLFVFFPKIAECNLCLLSLDFNFN